jgi:hypothetical protein
MVYRPKQYQIQKHPQIPYQYEKGETSPPLVRSLSVSKRKSMPGIAEYYKRIAVLTD